MFLFFKLDFNLKMFLASVFAQNNTAETLMAGLSSRQFHRKNIHLHCKQG